MDSTRIQPVGGSHAIEVMAIGVEWTAPLNDERIAFLRTVYEGNPDIKEFLPTLAPVQALVIQGVTPLNAASMGEEFQRHSPPQFIARNGGFDLQRFDDKGDIAWVASIRPEFISVNCTVYDRWKNVKPQALRILLPFVCAALPGGAAINAIGLQYQDAFRLLDGASPTETGELFRKNGKHLPLHLFEQPSFWHCHQGWFSEAYDKRRILNNIAIEVADVSGTHFARVGGQHRLFATSADGQTPMPIATEQIDEILQCLHSENITVINGILSDSALQAIGCTVGAS